MTTKPFSIDCAAKPLACFEKFRQLFPFDNCAFDNFWVTTKPFSIDCARSCLTWSGLSLFLMLKFKLCPSRQLIRGHWPVVASGVRAPLLPTMSGPSDLAQRVPAVAWPIPEISHLSIKEQKQVILFNARVSTIFPVPGKFSDFEYQELEIFLDQILLDSDRAFAQDKEPFWHHAYKATFHAVARCARLRHAGEEYDLMMTLGQIQCHFAK